MVYAMRLLFCNLIQCPHCGSNFITFDKLDDEPFCCICGWRRAIRITKSQARHHFNSEREFWNNLFAKEEDPDDPERSGSSGNLTRCHIRWLRAKIEENPENPRYLITIRNIGYKYGRITEAY
jgi:hypothetical protein